MLLTGHTAHNMALWFDAHSRLTVGEAVGEVEGEDVGEDVGELVVGCAFI